ncbi:class I SAM-dependent methyltransferase [Halomarina ordinaria]|uniref:Class I SAM-dependent methyltransferase n=1 Tax=Halomarina ordinaria TaxID=3033939 RepID=A0ABD5UCS7_9EURY|nr:class I SAM-dependent methyltransferase [Halomarina sp. PSRA2]
MESEEDALGTAMLDVYRDDLRGEAIHRDGAEVWDASIEANYFGPTDAWHSDAALYDSLAGPVLDVGCGAGQHALTFQHHGVDVTAFDVSPNAVRAARERGVEDARVFDMFDLPGPFTDAYRAVLLNGTQLGLAGSLPGVAALLADLAPVTDGSGVAVVDSYDPGRIAPEGFGGHRPDPREGVCRRTFHVEYDRAGERLVGPSLSFVLFSPARLRDACVGTPWSVREVLRRDGTPYYRCVLET